MTTVYIYGLWDPRDISLRYIGKTIRPKARLHRHLVDYDRGKITHCSTWVKGLLNDGLEPLMEILEECTEETWREAERGWIADGRNIGLRLTNMVDGGLGGAVRGRKLSIDQRKKMSESLMGRPGPMKGKKQTEEAKEKDRIGHLGKRPRLGMKNKPETNAKIGAANAIALKGRKPPPETVEKLHEALRIRWSRPESHQRASELNSKRPRNSKGQFVKESE